MTPEIQRIPLTKNTHIVYLTDFPLVPAMFCRLLISAIGKPSQAPGHGRVTKAQLRLNGVRPDPNQIHRYRRVCGFSHASEDPTVPPGFLQTLFIKILGRYITSDFFPLNPMGLIQTGQQFESKHPVVIGDILDLSCTLQDMTLTAKGISTRFLLEVHRDDQPVWQGVSTYLTRIPKPVDPSGKKVRDRPLPTRMTIRVPLGTGRRYARVSGDYNPHHLSDVTARIIGFKQAMAHGMWSLSRTLACLENLMTTTPPFSVDAAFKLPVYMPATLRMGCKHVVEGQINKRIHFDLRDATTLWPHLIGRVTCLEKES